MKYVVTGGAGFVGSYLVKLLINEGHSVIVIDNLVKGTKANLEPILDKIELHQIDIRDYESLKKILKNIDGVFHQAALTVVQDSFDRPEVYFEVNVVGTENIFKLANENNFKVVYASSSSVYGHKKTMPILKAPNKSGLIDVFKPNLPRGYALPKKNITKIISAVCLGDN